MKSLEKYFFLGNDPVVGEDGADPDDGREEHPSDC